MQAACEPGRCGAHCFKRSGNPFLHGVGWGGYGWSGRGKSSRRYVMGALEKGPRGLYMLTDGACKYVFSAPDGQAYFFDGAETENKLEACREQAEVFRRELISILKTAPDCEAVDGDDFRHYPVLHAVDSDSALLFQDNPAFGIRSFACPRPINSGEGSKLRSRLQRIKY